jgi:hypothetical protein
MAVGSARGADRRRSVDVEDPPLVEQRYAVTPIRLVHVRRRHDDRQPRRLELREQIPELPPRHRVDPRRRLVDDEVRGAVRFALQHLSAAAVCIGTSRLIR